MRRPLFRARGVDVLPHRPSTIQDVVVRNIAVGLCALLAAASCGPFAREATIERPKLQPDPWVLKTNDPTSAVPALLTNGVLGIRLDREGDGYGPDGGTVNRPTPGGAARNRVPMDEALPFFLTDEYDPKGEEKIRRLPNPLGLELTFNARKQELDPREEYLQSLDMRTGALSTNWSARDLVVESETWVHPFERIVAQKWVLRPKRNGHLSVRSFIAGEDVNSSGTPDNAIATLGPSAVKVRFQHHLTQIAETEWTTGSDGWVASGPAKAQAEPIEFYRVISFGLSPNLIEMNQVRGVEINVSPAAFEPIQLAGSVQEQFGQVVQISRDTWARRWETDIEIDGPVEDQAAVRSFLFYLQAATSPNARIGLGPMGLSHTQYNGHVFWDADIWVFPALALVNPAHAASITNYRLEMARGAEANHAQWVEAGRPTGTTSAPAVSAPGPALMYPWESSVSGLETVPGPSRHQHHITGSVLWGMHQASALGLMEPGTVQLIGEKAANFWKARSIAGPQGVREVHGVMSPDENHIGDNDLYTNILAEWTLRRFGGQPAVQFKRPRDATSLLTYDNDPVRSYKQAAAVLAIYPLQDPEAEKQAAVMIERFAEKVIPNGPAMSESVDALIWARLGETDKAYAAWRRSWQEFTAANPLMLFSEKRHRPITYFTTGAGGSLQSVLYGFLGFRLDSRKIPNASWSKPLLLGQTLSVRPNLPKEWRGVTFRNFRVLGQTYTLTVTQVGGKSSARVTSGT